ncbi:MAG: hypothetical protein ISS45_04610 [Candidatus Omnitrophica bacterium]|nr:hypothetical protein [Candidatus Omnitrophota bacterium]
MVNNLLIFLALFLCLNSRIAYADFSRDDYIWLEYADEAGNKSDMAMQHFFICYGQFPDGKKDIEDLDEIKAVYTFGEKGKSGEDIFYKLNIVKGEKKARIRVDSTKANWCAVLVKAAKSEQGLEYNYLAKTSFFILGSDSILNNAKRNALSSPFKRQFEINIYRERAKEDNTFYRRIGYPIGFSVNFDETPFDCKIINIIGDNGEGQQIKTDLDGSLSYIPQGDKERRQDLIIVEHILDNSIFKGSYTILFKHTEHIATRGRDLNVRLGVSIFMSSLAITFLLVIITRKRFRL